MALLTKRLADRRLQRHSIHSSLADSAFQSENPNLFASSAFVSDRQEAPIISIQLDCP